MSLPTAGSAAATPRRATLLFLDLLGYDALVETTGPERAYLLVTGCMAQLDAVARRHGGAVDKYLGDALMAVFGLAAAGSGEAAAIEAALEMREAAARYGRESASPVPLTVQVGVNTGLVLAGDVRGAIVREFAVMGDAVNVAARLKDRAAPGEIWIGEATRTALSDSLPCRALPPLSLKGKQRTVAAFALGDDARPAHRRRLEAALGVRLPLAGREAELAALAAAVARLTGGEGGVVVVSGPAGSGKTRLLAELLAREGGAAVRFVDARATAASHDAPDPWLDAIAEVDDTIPAHDPEARREIVERVAAAAARAPLALLLEDVQHARGPSRDALAALAALASRLPLLLVLTTREPARLPTVAHDGALHLPLAPLAPPAARALVSSVLGAGASPEVFDLVLARAGGNPGRLILGGFLAPALETEARRAREEPERSSEAERRRATVLFADISGFTALTERSEPAAAQRAVSGCLQLLDEVARRHGGSVDKYLGDCVMAVFGVPLALEDAPRAAVNAAIEMRGRVAEYNATHGLASPLDVHVGIETGPAIAGEIEGALLREWALMGGSVNAASRLKDLAPAGEIWLGEGAARATRNAFELEALPAEAAVGRRVLAPYRVASREARLHRARLGAGETLFTRLVGRDAELAALRERIERLARGEGGVVALVAEPGLGKSRLVAEAAASEPARGCRWLEGRSIAIGRSLSFHPFADLLRRFAGLSDGATDGYAALLAAAEGVLGGEAAESAPLLGALLGLALPAADAARIAEIPGDTLDNLMTRSLRALLAASAKERPLVLVFEDLHWADGSSIELLETLFGLARESAVLFLLVARPGFAETSERVAAAAERELPGRALRLALAPLETRGARELLRELFAREDLPRALRDRIETHTAGNPFFLEEVLRALLEEGALERVGTRLRATPRAGAAVVPGTVQDVILSRVDRLDPQRKLLLQIASVIGRRFERATLEAIARSVPGAAAAPMAGGDPVDRLVEAALLVAGSEPDSRLGFRHPMIQEVTYDSILEGRRVELHREVANQLEASTPQAPGLHATLAYHLGLGNELARAERHLLLAGEEAARSSASNEALHFFREAAALYARLHPGGGDPAVRAALAKNLALALFNRGYLHEASDRFNEALDLLGDRVARSRPAMLARFTRGLAGLLTELYAPSLVPTRRAAGERDREIIAVMFARAKAQTTGDPVRFLFDTMENVRRLRRVDPRSVEGSGGLYASMIGIFSFGGLSFGVSERLLRRARALVREGDRREQLQFRMMAYVHHFLRGDLGAAHEIEATTLEEGIRHGQLWDVVTQLHLEAYARTTRGEFAEAARRIEWIAALERDYAYEFACSNRQATTLFLRTEQRRLDEAAAAAADYTRDHDEPQINAFALGARAKVEILRGEIEAARLSLEAADAIVRRVPNIPPFNLATGARARLQLVVAELDAAARRGDERALRDAARDVRSATREALRRTAMVAWLRPEALALAGRAALRTGRRAAGVRFLERALDEAERLGARPERARVAVEAAALLGVGVTLAGRPLRAHLDESRRSFESLGLRFDLARLDDVVAERA